MVQAQSREIFLLLSSKKLPQDDDDLTVDVLVTNSKGSSAGKRVQPMRNSMNHSAFSPDVNADDVVSWESNESVGHAWWACAPSKNSFIFLLGAKILSRTGNDDRQRDQYTLE